MEKQGKYDRKTKMVKYSRDASGGPMVPGAGFREFPESACAMGHLVDVIQPRSGTFGFGQAVMSNGSGVHFAGSEPRTDGAAIPQAAIIKK